MRLLIAADYVHQVLQQGLHLVQSAPRPAVVGLALAGGYLLFRSLGNSRSASFNRRG